MISMIDILCTRNLHYVYPGSGSGLMGVSCRIPTGKRTVILGANGAGKSTLLLALSGVIRPQQGEVRLEGKPVDYSRAGLTRLRSKVGLVMQQPDVQLSCPQVYQDVAYGPTNLGLGEEEVRKRVEKSLAAVGAIGYQYQPVHCLSYGEKQRVALAGVLAMCPDLILLDEPTAELDSEGVNQLLVELERLRQNGTTIVMATHDLDLAWRWGDHFLVLEGGRVRWEGEHEELAREPRLFAQLGLKMPTVGLIFLALVGRGLFSQQEAIPRDVGELIRLLKVI